MCLLSLVPVVHLQKKKTTARISLALLYSKMEQIRFANADYALYQHHALQFIKHFYTFHMPTAIFILSLK